MTSNNLKKTALAAVMMCTLCIAAYLGMPKEQDNELLLANVEALADGEDGGLDVSACYFPTYGIGESYSYLECDEKTTTSRIYPCPNTSSFFTAKSRGTCIKR